MLTAQKKDPTIPNYDTSEPVVICIFNTLKELIGQKNFQGAATYTTLICNLVLHENPHMRKILRQPEDISFIASLLSYGATYLDASKILFFMRNLLDFDAKEAILEKDNVLPCLVRLLKRKDKSNFPVFLSTLVRLYDEQGFQGILRDKNPEEGNENKIKHNKKINEKIWGGAWVYSDF